MLWGEAGVAGAVVKPSTSLAFLDVQFHSEDQIRNAQPWIIPKQHCQKERGFLCVSGFLFTCDCIPRFASFDFLELIFFLDGLDERTPFARVRRSIVLIDILT